MSDLYIELNDWQFTLFDNQEVLYSDVAAASSYPGALEFGTNAWHHARLAPQQFNARFLMNLAADPIPAIGQAQNMADLIYYQFMQIAERVGSQACVVGIPGYVSNEQLGLLLGIAQQAGIEVRGFVDLALACAAGQGIVESTQVVDLELYRLVTTRIERSGEELAVRHCELDQGVGALNLIDSWLNLIADDFVTRTRFDPMHDGACEQQLFNQMSDYAQGLSTPSSVYIEHGGVRREADLSSSALQAKTKQRTERVNLEAPVLLTHRAAAFPGLQAALQDRGLQISIAGKQTTQQGMRQLAGLLPANQVARIRSCASNAPAGAATAGSTKTSSASIPPPVTHLLAEGIAAPIDQLAPDQPLTVGQEIQLDGVKYLAIHVPDGRV